MNDAVDRKEAVVDELAAIELGDSRLNFRARSVSGQLAMNPALSFPEALATEADLEGFYRLLRNEKVTAEAILAPHQQATVGRVAEQETVLAVHDSTEFVFGGKSRRDMGVVMLAGTKLHGHFCLAVSADGHRDPLGVLATKTWTRDGGPTPSSLRKKGVAYTEVRAMPSEYTRWRELIDEAEARVDGKASLIHVMDSESDDYDLMCHLKGANRRFLLRACRERKLDAAGTGSIPGEKLRQFVARAEVCAVRDVKLSRRNTRHVAGITAKRDLPRDKRTATLEFAATTVTIARTVYAVKTLSPSVSVNVVSVKEKDAPEGMEPVDWLLFTSEPIDTEQQILRIVDLYRARWVIEEYFKAIKTGCDFEARQLESKATLVKALALFIPVAWILLRMRAASRSPKKASILTVLSLAQITVLKKATGIPLRKNSSAAEAYLAVARLGGHIKNNGPPGWQVLGRGYAKLLTLETGFKIGRSQTCDQW
jgi:hypothetical protein